MAREAVAVVDCMLRYSYPAQVVNRCRVLVESSTIAIVVRLAVVIVPDYFW